MQSLLYTNANFLRKYTDVIMANETTFCEIRKYLRPVV